MLHHAQTLLAQRDLPGALSAFDCAELGGSQADACSGGRWFAHMLAGNFPAAWKESDAIRGRNAPDANRFWQGDDLRGKCVILRCLHGFGDAVQFLRYAPRLKELSSQLIVEVPPAMLDVAGCFDGVDRVATWGTRDVPVAWDLQIEIMELPHLFRTSMDDLPIATQYLRLPVAAECHAARLMGQSTVPRVGLVWTAGDWNSERSLPLSLLRALLEMPEIECWSLQGGAARQDCLALHSNLRDAAVCGEGILPLAAVICHLDLVITVDTLAAHLAGAMDKPVWVLLPYAADWRWMTERSDSPWYPSARLFRQPDPGNWESVVGSIQLHLAEWFGL
jgi:hypothetical protein